MNQFLADESRTILITPNGSWVPGTPSYIEIKAEKLKTQNSKILLEKIIWTMNGCTFPIHNFVSGGGTINTTCQKVKSIGLKCMRENDEGSCNGIFVSINPPFTQLKCSCKFKIVKGGINKVKGE